MNRDEKTATVIVSGPMLSAVSGVSTHLYNLLSSPLKLHFRFVHFKVGSRGTVNPASDEPIFAKLWRITVSPILLVLEIAKTRPDLIHLNTSLNHKAFWRDLVYLFIGKLSGRAVICQIHGGSIATFCANKAMQQIARITFSAADAVIVLSDEEKENLLEIGCRNRLAVIPNAIDTRSYGGNGRRHSGRVRKLSYLGRLVREKGLFEAIEATRILRDNKQFNDIEFFIGGAGPAKEELEKRIHEYRLEKTVRLIGTVSASSKMRFLRETDIFVFPSYHEAVPYAILESLAAGTPVVASRVGAIPEMIVEGKHGVLVRPRDVSEIVRAVIWLAESGETLRVMSKNCVEHAAECFGIESFAEAVQQIYYAVLRQ